MEVRYEPTCCRFCGQRVLVSDSDRPIDPSNVGRSRISDAHRAGKLCGSGGRAELTAEQMEIRRLRAELARVTMERDILGKATAFFAKGQR